MMSTLNLTSSLAIWSVELLVGRGVGRGGDVGSKTTCEL
jgi:hypothetical protein